jgi:hypothetical protein
MNMQTREEAVTYACEVSNRCLTREESERRLTYFRSQHDRSTDSDAKEVWRNEIEQIENWQASDKFKNGDFPRGIDELMLELIEWRALKYALQNVQTERSPFTDHVFFQQWLIGGTYAVFALLGQLVSKDDRDNSLRKLWRTVVPFIERDGACAPDEMRHIDRELLGRAGRFTNENSKAILFRNTTIAHNEKQTRLTWNEIDKDIEILVRVWSIIGAWASFGLHDPFRTADQAFSGLEPYFAPSELKALRVKRGEYLHRVIQWSLNHLHNGERDPAAGIFRKWVVTAEVFLRL